MYEGRKHPRAPHTELSSLTGRLGFFLAGRTAEQLEEAHATFKNQ